MHQSLATWGNTIIFPILLMGNLKYKEDKELVKNQPHLVMWESQGSQATRLRNPYSLYLKVNEGLYIICIRKLFPQ